MGNGNIYTKEDLETYIEYTVMLHRMIMDAFSLQSPVHIEDTSPDVADKITSALDNATMTSAMVNAVETVFKELMIPFSEWLFNDCPFTGHKAKEIPRTNLHTVIGFDTKELGKEMV